MHSELPWQRLFELHAVKKIVQIIGRRWRLGVGWVDVKRRQVQPPTPSHVVTVCEVVQRREGGARACAATASEALHGLVDADRRGALPAAPFSITCHAGLTELVAPIVIDGRCAGALLCGGFFTAADAPSAPTEPTEPTAPTASTEPTEPTKIERQLALASLDRRTAPLALAPDAYAHARDAHPWLDPHEVSFVGELLAAATEEIAVYHRAAGGHVADRAAPNSDSDSDSDGDSDGDGDAHARRGYGDIIGESAPMQALYDVLDRVVRSDSTVLIQGENGTGKELVARAIHYGSDRVDRRFVVTNCSAFNDNLLDSELFGHKKGAFTGAIGDKQGLFEIADRGTFFLDEIGDMSPSLQVKVLRVLQEGTFTPVGDTVTRKVDVRIIAASNRDLQSMVAGGAFREDLYYRINVINLRVPPLRERDGDIDQLVDHFLRAHTQGRGEVTPALTEGCRERLRRYAWPGNVRELENEIERLIVLAGDERHIDEQLLSSRIRSQEAAADGPAPQTRSLPQAVRQLERRMILQALERNKWNKTRAAEELQVSRRNLIRLVQKYELEPPRGDRGEGSTAATARSEPTSGGDRAGAGSDLA